ncbi:MAG: DUF2505 family protein [Sandaracinus sp.]|nr:DUF2505 family protein [Sandaracinus sp.]
MKTFTMRHPINCAAADFWTKLHYGGFNESLFRDHLGFGYEFLEDDQTTGKRKTLVVPKVDAPAVLVKALGEKVSFEEHGQLHRDRDPVTYEFHVQPGVFPNKIKINGKMHMEADGPDKCFRVVTFNIECTIFGIGGIFEKFVSAEIQRSYDVSGKYTNEFLQKKQQG